MAIPITSSQSRRRPSDSTLCPTVQRGDYACTSAQITRSLLAFPQSLQVFGIFGRLAPVRFSLIACHAGAHLRQQAGVDWLPGYDGGTGCKECPVGEYSPFLSCSKRRYGAGSGSRTRKNLPIRWILSPLRLPIPPSRPQGREYKAPEGRAARAWQAVRRRPQCRA
jgi:hypothetical protein